MSARGRVHVRGLKFRVKDVSGEAAEAIEAYDSPVEDCYGVSEYMCYVVAQMNTPPRSGKVKVIASW